MKTRQYAASRGHFSRLASLAVTALLCVITATTASAQIDINRADAKTLAETMSGVGLVRAEAIVAYRNAHGPFHSVEELSRIDGIGTRTIAANRTAIVIIEPVAPAASQAGGAGKPFASR